MKCPKCGGDMARKADTPWKTHPTTVCAQCVAEEERAAWIGSWMRRISAGNYEDFET